MSMQTHTHRHTDTAAPASATPNPSQPEPEEVICTLSQPGSLPGSTIRLVDPPSSPGSRSLLRPPVLAPMRPLLPAAHVMELDADQMSDGRSLMEVVRARMSRRPVVVGGGGGGGDADRSTQGKQGRSGVWEVCGRGEGGVPACTERLSCKTGARAAAPGWNDVSCVTPLGRRLELLQANCAGEQSDTLLQD